MKTFILMGLVVLMPFAMAMAQSGQWQFMDGPYYIDSVTSISIGYQGGNTYAYAVGSDLQYTYVYSYQGDSPITQWSNVNQPFRIDGLKYISASRYNGRTAYASVPEGSIGTPGTYVMLDGAPWQRTSSQPENTDFTGISAHPNSSDICFTSSKHVDGVSSIYQTTNGGVDWSEVNTSFCANTCTTVCIDPNSSDQLGGTILYAGFAMDENHQGGGIYKSENGGGAWGSRIDLYGGDAPYNALSVAVKKLAGQGNIRSVYAVTSHYVNSQLRYDLWLSQDDGSNWTQNPFGFSGNTLDTLISVSVNDYLDGSTHRDLAYVLGKRNFYFYVWEGNYWRHKACDFVWDIPYALAVDTADYNGQFSWGQAYFGGQFCIHSYDPHRLDQEIPFAEAISNTNPVDVISLDCIEGGYLYMLGRKGGYIISDGNIGEEPATRTEYSTEDCFLRMSSVSTAFEGKRISPFFLDGGVEKYIACGNEGSTGYIAYTDDQNGLECSQWNWDPERGPLSVLTGPHFLGEPHFQPGPASYCRADCLLDKIPKAPVHSYESNAYK
jgi:hypothetical protein